MINPNVYPTAIPVVSLKNIMRIVIPFGVILFFNYALISISLSDLQEFYIMLRDSRPNSECGMINYSAIMIGWFIPLLIFSIGFKNTLRKKVRIVRFLLPALGIFMLFLAGSLVYLELRFKISQIPLSGCDQEFLPNQLLNIALLGFEMLFLGLLLRKKVTREQISAA